MKTVEAHDPEGKLSLKVNLVFTLGELGVGRSADFRWVGIFDSKPALRKAWAIYHIPSGAAFPTEFPKKAEAIKATKFAKTIGAWTFPPADGMAAKWFKKYPARIIE